MRQLSQNVISNALKFGRDRPPLSTVQNCPVTSRVRALFNLPNPKAHVISKVTDNGIGFDMKCTDKILGTFQRLNSKGEFSGTGIGLAICRRIAENHQGCIAAESQPNQDAAFTFYCPLSSKERT